MSHTVDVTMSLSVSTKGSFALMAAGGGLGGTEAERLQRAADANLDKLIAAASRYGFDVSDVSVTIR